MAPRSSSVLLLVLVRRILSGFFGVFECTCVSVCHFRVDKRIRTIFAVNPTKAKNGTLASIIVRKNYWPWRAIVPRTVNQLS